MRRKQTKDFYTWRIFFPLDRPTNRATYISLRKLISSTGHCTWCLTSHTAQLATDCNELLGNQRVIIMHVFCRLDMSQAKMLLLASQHGVAGPRMKPRETKMLPLCTRWHFWTTNHGASRSNAAVVCWDCASGCGDTTVIGSAGSVPVVYDAQQRRREKPKLL